MNPRQPTFFRHQATLYATYPGGPARGILGEPGGIWVATIKDLDARERSMAFQVFSHAIANFSLNIGAAGSMDGGFIRFCCADRRKHELRTLLVSAWYGSHSFSWTWIEDTVIVPEDAKWVPHPNAID